MNTQNKKKRYGIVRFAVDFLLTVFTGGLWLCYLIFRALRNR